MCVCPECRCSRCHKAIGSGPKLTNDWPPVLNTNGDSSPHFQNPGKEINEETSEFKLK